MILRRCSRLQILYDDRLVIHKLDVADYGSRRDLFQALAVETEKLDVLINNAGVISGNERFSYAFGELQQDDLCRALLVNSVAPLMMAEGVFPLLEKGSKPMVVNISRTTAASACETAGVNMVTVPAKRR